jgi:hypothetical protein
MQRRTIPGILSLTLLLGSLALGQELGNPTFSHLSLRDTPVPAFVASPPK